jgi:hypothetical protein
VQAAAEDGVPPCVGPVVGAAVRKGKVVGLGVDGVGTGVHSVRYASVVGIGVGASVPVCKAARG